MAIAAGGVGIALSVVVPAYRAEKTIRRAVGSVLLWSGDDMEVVVVDDGSDDDTAEIVRDISKQDARVRLVQQGNAGRSAARNTGSHAARGEWVMFMDADDYLLADGISCVQSMTASSSSLVLFPAILSTRANVIGYSDMSWPGGDGIAEDVPLPASALRSFMIDPVGSDLSPGVLKRLRWYEINSAWSRLYRRETVMRLFSVLGEGRAPFPANLRFSEDKLFNLAFLASLDDEEIVLSGHPVYYWDLGSSNTCAVVRVDDAEEILPFREAVDLLAKDGFLTAHERDLVLAQEVLGQFRRSARLDSSELSMSKHVWRGLLRDEDIRSCIGIVPCATAMELIRTRSVCCILSCGLTSAAFWCERSALLVKRLLAKVGLLRRSLLRSARCG